jgi:hypothetical protein
MRDIIGTIVVMLLFAPFFACPIIELYFDWKIKNHRDEKTKMKKS